MFNIIKNKMRIRKCAAKLRFARKYRAVTLVELLVYLALFAIVFASMLSYTLAIEESNRRSLRQNQLQKYTVYLNEHIQDSFDSSKAIDSADSVFNSDEGKLILTTFDNGTITYRQSAGKIYVVRDDNAEVQISPDNLFISKFYFQEIQNGKNELVGVQMNFMINSRKFTGVTNTVQTNFILP